LRSLPSLALIVNSPWLLPVGRVLANRIRVPSGSRTVLVGAWEGEQSFVAVGYVKDDDVSPGPGGGAVTCRSVENTSSRGWADQDSSCVSSNGR
jgi:hypothetical protein